MPVTNFGLCCKSDEIQFRTAEDKAMDTRFELLSAQILNIQPSGILHLGFEEPVDTSVTVCNQTRRHKSDDFNRRGN
jgi:hypothetical protein